MLEKEKNLPIEINEKFFGKLKKWFYKIIHKNGKGENSNFIAEDICKEKNIENFRESLKIKQNNVIYLKNKLNNGELGVEDLTDQELDEMIDFYKQHISESKKKILEYKKLKYTN